MRPVPVCHEPIIPSIDPNIEIAGSQRFEPLAARYPPESSCESMIEKVRPDEQAAVECRDGGRDFSTAR